MVVDWNDLLIGIVLGGVLGWVISYYFHKRERKEAVEKSRLSEKRKTLMQRVTEDEFKEVEHRAILMLRAIENAGIAKFTRNKKGEFIGLEHRGQVHVYTEGKLEMKGTEFKGGEE
jgi:hypothetical protein